MKNNPIGILDSGVGGLSVLQAISKALPQESILYIADSGNAPYGSKSEEFITERAEKLVAYLLQHSVKLIVVACNTITVTSLDILRKKHPDIKIVGVVPVIKTAIQQTRNGKIGVLSTTTTAHSDYQKQLIKQFAQGYTVVNLGTNQLVPLIEAGELSGERIQKRLNQVLAPFQKEDIDTLALGCTHFPLIRKEIEKVLGEKVSVLDSGGAVARQVKRLLVTDAHLSKDEPVYHIVTTGDPGIAKKIAATTIKEHEISVSGVQL